MAGGAPGGLPLLDPVGALQLRDPPAVEAAARARSLGAALGGFRCVHGPRFPQLVRGGGGGGPLWSSFVGSFWCRLGILRVVWGHWGSLWGHLGLSFGILRCHLGIVWGLFCAIWGLIWVTLGPLGQFWDHLGHLGAVWGDHLGLFLCNLFHFGAIWVPSGSLVPVGVHFGAVPPFFLAFAPPGAVPPRSTRSSLPGAACRHRWSSSSTNCRTAPCCCCPSTASASA